VILTVGRVAAGGACGARAEDGRVVFVRHALPGETVRVVVTSDGARFLRADAVEVLSPSPDPGTAPSTSHGRCADIERQTATQAEMLGV
jgi:tRNA/tmRNA/rRNA uracil-C5-methylase (TrmA/RlmC/RlmD family)